MGVPRGEDRKFYKINNDRFIDSTPAKLKRSSAFPTLLPMASRNENALGTLWEARAFLNNTTAVTLGRLLKYVLANNVCTSTLNPKLNPLQ